MPDTLIAGHQPQREPAMQAALDELFATSEPLRLSADIANIVKHFAAARGASARSQRNMCRAARGGFGRDGQLVVLSKGKNIDARELAAECETAWLEFLPA